MGDLYLLATSQNLLESVLGDGNPTSQRTKLGMALAKMIDRIFDERRISLAAEPKDKRGGTRQYKLTAVTAKGRKPRTSSEQDTTQDSHTTQTNDDGTFEMVG